MALDSQAITLHALMDRAHSKTIPQAPHCRHSLFHTAMPANAGEAEPDQPAV